MKALFIKLSACAFGIMAAGLIFAPGLSFVSGCVMLLLLSAMYILLRPLAQILILPLNIFMLGALTIASDALFVLWAAAWSLGCAAAYWQALIIAAVILAAELLLRRIFSAGRSSSPFRG